jgi:chromosome segregation ATPase
MIKEKSLNAKEFKTMTQEYENKIKLKSTQLDNFEVQNSSLESQIEDLLSELNTVQEKAHILASKTIDANSSIQSFEAMKDVAMEQARGKK